MIVDTFRLVYPWSLRCALSLRARGTYFSPSVDVHVCACVCCSQIQYSCDMDISCQQRGACDSLGGTSVIDHIYTPFNPERISLCPTTKMRKRKGKATVLLRGRYFESSRIRIALSCFFFPTIIKRLDSASQISMWRKIRSLYVELHDCNKIYFTRARFYETMLQHCCKSTMYEK